MGKKSLLTLQTVTKKVVLQSENVNIVKKNPATAIYTATGWTFLV